MRIAGIPEIELHDVQVSLDRLIALLDVKGGRPGFIMSSAVVPVVDVTQLVERSGNLRGGVSGIGTLIDPQGGGYRWVNGTAIVITAAINNAIDFVSFQNLVPEFTDFREQRLRIKQAYLEATFTVADQTVQPQFVYIPQDGVTILEHITAHGFLVPQGPLAARQSMLERLPTQRLETETNTTTQMLGVRYSAAGTLAVGTPITLNPRLLLRVEPR